MNATDAVNYGAIGVVMGHEVSHGFDDEGSQFDAQGKLNNWWTPDDLKKFQAKTGCVVKQFDGYYIEPNIHHNGKLVLGESIGDLAGVKIAYLAYQNSQKGKPPAPTIDGFTPDEQFFIAWGQFRGDATRLETQKHDDPGRSASGGQVSRHRTTLELQAIPADVLLQRGKRHGASGGGPCVVW